MWSLRVSVLVLVAAAVTAVHATTYVNVVPIQSELVAICGPYANATATFTCYTYTPGVGYSNCADRPYNCQCLPEAPPQFQQSGYPPCAFNYEIVPCTADVDAPALCGPHALGCTKRCNYLGQCLVAEACTCEAGYAQPLNQQYCSYEFQIDICNNHTALFANRETTACGLFVESAVALCPNNVTYDMNNCTTNCTCKFGTGQTPVPGSLPCDGVDRPCNSFDVTVGCGATGYLNCTKRCQFTPGAPNLQLLCAVLPGTCQKASTILPPPTPCSAALTTSKCGLGASACMQNYNEQGDISGYSCTCGPLSFAFGGIPCQAWIADNVNGIAPPQSVCASTCGPGYTGCNQTTIWTPSDQYLPCPGQCFSFPCTNCTSLSRTQRQKLWFQRSGLFVGQQGPGVVISVLAFNTLIQQGTQFTQAYNTIECTCDWSVIDLMTTLAENHFPASELLDLGPLLYSYGAGANDFYGTAYGTGSSYNFVLPSPPNSANVVMYPGLVAQPDGPFYNNDGTCYGPYVNWNVKVAYNDLSTCAPQRDLVRVTVGPGGPQSSSVYLGVIWSDGNTYDLPCYSLNDNGGHGAILFEQGTPPSVCMSTWNQYYVGDPQLTIQSFLLTYQVKQLDQLNAVNSFECATGAGLPINGNYVGIDQLFQLSRQAQVMQVAKNQFERLYYADPTSVGSLDGTGICGGSIRGAVAQSFTVDQEALTGFGGAALDYLGPTLRVTKAAFMIYPNSVTGSSGNDDSYDATAYGPINLLNNNYTGFVCECYPGWIGYDCRLQSQYPICFTTADPNFGFLQCPAGACADASCINDPAVPFLGGIADPPTAVIRYELQVVAPGLQYLTLSNCPFFPNNGNPTQTAVGTANGTCDMTAYGLAAQRACGHGTPVFNSFIDGLTCACAPGWTTPNTTTASGFIGPPDTLSCHVAGIDPVNNVPNGPVPLGTGSCAINATFTSTQGIAQGYGPRTRGCVCGGHGYINEEGSCVCDQGWLRNLTTGGCDILNECPTAAACQLTDQSDNHTAYCNQTQFAPANWVCSNATNEGYWTGLCCQTFVAFGTCVYGGFLPGEVTVNGSFTGPVSFTSANVNQNSMVCSCYSGAYTGATCNDTSCPIGPNGLVCSGVSECRNGLCVNDDSQCDNEDLYGCACQYNILEACQGGQDTNRICSSGAASPHGNCVASLTPQITIGCQCLGPYTGPICADSACGASNCNAASGGGQCIPVPGSPTGAYMCSCTTQDPVACKSGQGCLFGGPTCDVDITSICAAIDVVTDLATTCNLQGSCIVTRTTPTVQGYCNCSNNYTGQFCQTSPCPQQCGENGFCNQQTGTPFCQCNPHWFTPTGPGSTPCSVHDCGANAIPSGSICVCLNPAYMYYLPWVTSGSPPLSPSQAGYSYAPCTQLACNSTAGGLVPVPCSPINCLAPGATNCLNMATQTCIAGCQTHYNQAGGGFGANICDAGVCVCDKTSTLNMTTGLCDPICAFPPLTTAIDAVGSSIVCTCADGYSSSDGCYLPICLNGGTCVPDPETGLCTGICACPPNYRKEGRCTTPYCGDHGFFPNNDPGRPCSCYFPWTGTQCDQYLCDNGGVPQISGTGPTGVCVCPNVYFGTLCQNVRCVHGVPNADGSACVCEGAWQGIYCDVIGCNPPGGTVVNSTCVCNSDYYGPGCAYRVCGFGYLNTTTDTCQCTGVATLQPTGSGGYNCTGNSCGSFGLPTTDRTTCICNTLSTFIPTSQLTSSMSYNCLPWCQNGGSYRNEVPIGCDCPPEWQPPICATPTPTPGYSSSSSTGTMGGGNSSSSTGSTSGTSKRTPFNGAVALLTFLCVCIALI